MFIIKEYVINLDDKAEQFYESMSKLMNKTVEDIMEEILEKNVETMMKMLDINI